MIATEGGEKNKSMLEYAPIQCYLTALKRGGYELSLQQSGDSWLATSIDLTSGEISHRTGSRLVEAVRNLWLRLFWPEIKTAPVDVGGGNGEEGCVAA
jgi:hypothetical protein